MAKQTPVKLLQEVIKKYLTDEQNHDLQKIFERVIDLEKTHIELAFQSGDLYYKDYSDGKKRPSENYYDKTYEGGNNE